MITTVSGAGVGHYQAMRHALIDLQRLHPGYQGDQAIATVVRNLGFLLTYQSDPDGQAFRHLKTMNRTTPGHAFPDLPSDWPPVVLVVDGSRVIDPMRVAGSLLVCRDVQPEGSRVIAIADAMSQAMITGNPNQRLPRFRAV